MASRISSKDSFDKGVLGGGRKEILLFVFIVLGLVRGNVGKNVKTRDGGRRDGGTSDDVSGAVRDVEKGIFFLGYPEFLAAVINNSVLVRVAVDGVSAGGGVEKVGE